MSGALVRVSSRPRPPPKPSIARWARAHPESGRTRRRTRPQPNLDREIGGVDRGTRPCTLRISLGLFSSRSVTRCRSSISSRITFSLRFSVVLLGWSAIGRSWHRPMAFVGPLISPQRAPRHTERNGQGFRTIAMAVQPPPYSWTMVYPRVERAHVVPRCYLKQFAEDEMIGMRLVGDPTSKVISIDDAAVRKQFYRRTRPDGTPIDDIEWSLSHIESDAAPLLKTFGNEWPPSLETKTILAGLFALQLVRGPRWKDWHETFAKGYVDEQRDADDPTRITRTDQTVGVVSAADLERHLLGDTHRLTGMAPARSQARERAWLDALDARRIRRASCRDVRPSDRPLATRCEIAAS